MTHCIGKVRRFCLLLPGADSVSALGKFNNWSTTATFLTKLGGGRWELRLPDNLNADDLSFFVVPHGARSGYAVAYATLALTAV
jgi:1,4-alpha-glucan branching enzyme